MINFWVAASVAVLCNWPIRQHRTARSHLGAETTIWGTAPVCQENMATTKNRRAAMSPF